MPTLDSIPFLLTWRPIINMWTYDQCVFEMYWFVQLLLWPFLPISSCYQKCLQQCATETATISSCSNMLPKLLPKFCSCQEFLQHLAIETFVDYNFHGELLGLVEVHHGFLTCELWHVTLAWAWLQGLQTYPTKSYMSNPNMTSLDINDTTLCSTIILCHIMLFNIWICIVVNNNWIYLLISWSLL